MIVLTTDKDVNIQVEAIKAVTKLIQTRMKCFMLLI